ncbi:MAG: zinc-regulated TonB-dependent outer membrane receptor, partial [Nitrospiria bacterium]
EALETGAHDPNQRGFTVQNIELTLSGNVDPYFTAIGHVIFGIDREGESFLEVEEAYLTSTALPANLQLRGGQFFTPFGRLNPQHPHTWAFVDQPLVNGRLFGGDGMRGPGMQLSYLLPLPVYAEAMVALQNSQGETMFSFRNAPGESLFGRTLIERRVEGVGDLVVTPRLTTSFNPSDTQTLLLGVSGAFGPNGSGRSARTELYGIDLYYKWKPLETVKGWPFVTWQTEVMTRRYDNAADGTFPEEQLRDWGGYMQLTWGFVPRWVAGLRGEYVAGENGDLTDPLRERRVRVSPNLTFYPSEFSKWRVQYNRDDVASRDDLVHSIFLQWEFLIGAHGAHTF